MKPERTSNEYKITVHETPTTVHVIGVDTVTGKQICRFDMLFGFVPTTSLVDDIHRIMRKAGYKHYQRSFFDLENEPTIPSVRRKP